MIEKIEGIVIDVVKHTDRHNVVTLFTRSHGRMAFLVPAARTKAGMMRNAVINLMNVVGSDINIRPGKDLYNLRQVTPLRLWHGIYADPLKSSLLFFIAEFCNKLLRQYPPDEKVWQYIVESLEVLDSLPHRGVANFHICFLINMLTLTGIKPDVKWKPGDCFDMLSGGMIDDQQDFFTRKTAPLPTEESRHIPLLLRMTYRNMGYYRFNRMQRNRVLDRLLEFYSTHLPLGNRYKSVEILREVFS